MKYSEAIREGIKLIPNKFTKDYFDDTTAENVCAACVNGTFIAGVEHSTLRSALKSALESNKFQVVWSTYVPRDLAETLINLRNKFTTEPYWRQDVTLHFAGVILNDFTDMTREEIADFFEQLGY